MSKWLGIHQWSTWMIFASLILMAMTAHPSLLAYLVVLINGAFLFVIREVSRGEGQVIHMNLLRIVASLVVIGMAMLFALRINWLAL